MLLRGSPLGERHARTSAGCVLRRTRTRRRTRSSFAVITWAKTALLAEIARENPFGSSHLAWIDFGYAHVGDLRLGGNSMKRALGARGTTLRMSVWAAYPLTQIPGRPPRGAPRPPHRAAPGCCARACSSAAAKPGSARSIIASLAVSEMRK